MCGDMCAFMGIVSCGGGVQSVEIFLHFFVLGDEGEGGSV